MKIKKLFNLSTIILGVMMLCSFSNVQATESIFSDITPTRDNAQAYKADAFSDSQITPITLEIAESEYKTNVDEKGNGGYTYWTIKDSNGEYKDIYCLNLSRGFGEPDGDITDSNKTQKYNNPYDLNNISDTEYSTLTGLSSSNKNKILWILNNSLTSKDDLSVILNAASAKLQANSDTEKFIKSDMKLNTRESTKITFEDIKMVQQIAVWHYTNPGSIFDNTISGICNSEGKQISSLAEENIDIYGYGYGPFIENGKVKQAKLNALYQYFIDGAETGENISEVPSLILSEENVKINESGNSYIVGPFKLIGENASLIKQITVNSNIPYTLLETATSTQGVSDNDFTKVINKEFYLKVNKQDIKEDREVKINLTYKYDTRNLTFLTNELDYENTQPVVLVESEELGDDLEIVIPIPVVNISVEKVWNDNEDQDGTRKNIDQVKVKLYINGKEYKNAILSKLNNWKYTWDEVLHVNGNTYTVKELTKNGNVVENGGKYNNDYITTYQVDGNKTTITNTHIPETIDISGTKTWVDNNNQDGVRPESIVVNLLANDEEVKEATATADNNWEYTFEDLPKYKDGEEIEYTITEDEVPEYAVKIEGYNITNTYNPEVTEKTVTKIWEDGNDSDEIRPSSIEIQLYKTIDEEKTSMGEKYKVILNTSNNWTYTWKELPVKEDGKQITYTAEEVEVPQGYTVTYSEDTFTIKNIHVPKDLAIGLEKVDEQGNVIASSEATFEIEGSQEVTAKTSKGILNLDSQKLLSNFEFDYTIKETEAPIGYNKIEEELSVKISGTAKLENGSYKIDTINITDKDGNALDSTKILAEYDEALNKVVIKIVNTKIINSYSVKLLKVSEDGITPINGAWFKIDDEQAIIVSEDGKEIATGTLNEAGELNLTYKLEETTAPNGYIKLEGQKEVKINAKVELKDNEYQLTEVKLVENLDGISVSEEDNVITIKVENEIEITGKYNVVLRKVDEAGNILNGSKFKISGTEYDLSTGEAIIYENQQITEENLLNGIDFTYILEETVVPVGYNGIENTEINIKAQVKKVENNYKLIRATLVDGEGNNITDENISIKLEGDSIVIVVKNTPIEKVFDLALRKFITKVNDIEYQREPVVDTSTIASTGTATYKHIKQPIPVQKGDIITYTIRVYNEGEVDGYVDKITDYLPDNLIPLIVGTEGIDEQKYAKEIEFNLKWGWIASVDGKSVTTMKTAKVNSETYSLMEGYEEVTDTKLNAYVEGSNTLDYIDVQIKCLVADTASSYEYLTNIAEITESQDINGNMTDGIDSTLGNVDYSNLSDYKNNEAINSAVDSYVPGQEDDDDFEKLVVKEFDLSLRKFITKVNDVMYARVPIVDTSKLGTVVDGKTITTATYNHSKAPVIVETGDIVTYTIRIYNEGSLEGYAKEITDNIPEGLEFLPESEINTAYEWKMLDKEGNITGDISNAVMITTDYLSDNMINHVTEENDIKVLDYKDVEVQFKVVAKAKNLQDNIIINEAQISADSDRDIDSVPNRDEKYDYDFESNEDDIDYEPIKLQYFDLALRKFITRVNSVDYNNRYPEIKYNEDRSITYTHTKDPVLVTTNDVVTYTIRVYNEGEKAGYATEIKDNLPDGLAFYPDNETNKKYGWKMLDSEGNVTEDASKVVAFSTDYLKDELIDAFKEENDKKILSYKDVQIAFTVVEPNTSNRILVNTAQISNDSDDDIDSIPNNNVETEDDLDKEYVRVEYFDLALKKWVTRTEVTYNGKTTTTKTGFDEDSEGIAKVDLVASKMTKTTVKFAFNIKVTNEGELPGYAYEVKDYIPKGLKFVAEDNKNWKELEDGTVVTDSLKDTLLNPGESAMVEIVLTWKNSTTNTGLKTNYAEISKDSADDFDSIPDNYDFTEDDIDDAQVLLSIKTAGAPTYIGLILITIAILAGGIFLIKKYVIN